MVRFCFRAKASSYNNVVDLGIKDFRNDEALGRPQSLVSPKTERGVAGCPRGGGSGKPAHSAGLTRRGKLPPTKKTA
jgi:hypothetical protein